MANALCVLPFVFLGGLVWAVIADIRTGSGYGLGILTSLHLALTIFFVVTIISAAQQQTQPPSLHNGSPLIFLFFYFVAAAYAIGFVMIGVAVVAGKARHWGWLAGFFVAVLVPVVITVHPHPFWLLNSEYMVQNVGYLGILFVPEATVLAYSLARLIHPVPVARALASPSVT